MVVGNVGGQEWAMLEWQEWARVVKKDLESQHVISNQEQMYLWHFRGALGGETLEFVVCLRASTKGVGGETSLSPGED